MRRLLIYILLAASLPATAQHPAFSVATIKPSMPDAPTMTQIRGKRFATTGTTFFDLFQYAYSVHSSQVIGGPEWLQTAKFDVLADPDGEARPSSDQMKELVQQLLTERFHVVMRRETRELPVYALVKTSAVPKLALSTAADPNGIPVGAGSGRGDIGMRNGTITNFASFLQRFAGPAIDRPVVDQTGVSGRFDVDFHFTPDNVSSPETASAPGIFTAIQEQLGLKLKSTKAPINVYVIDSATRPGLDL